MMRMKTKQQATAETAPDPAAELRRLLRRLADAVDRMDPTITVPAPCSPAVTEASDRLAALNEKAVDLSRRESDILERLAKLADLERNRDEQARRVLDGEDVGELARSRKALSDELAETQQQAGVLKRAIELQRIKLADAIRAESRDAAAAVLPSFKAAAEALGLALRIAQTAGPEVRRIRGHYEKQGYALGSWFPNVDCPYSYMSNPAAEYAPGQTVTNPTDCDLFIAHLRREGFDV